MRFKADRIGTHLVGCALSAQAVAVLEATNSVVLPRVVRTRQAAIWRVAAHNFWQRRPRLWTSWPSLLGGQCRAARAQRLKARVNLNCYRIRGALPCGTPWATEVYYRQPRAVQAIVNYHYYRAYHWTSGKEIGWQDRSLSATMCMSSFACLSVVGGAPRPCSVLGRRKSWY